MQNFELTLQSKPHRSFRCQKAADSLDIDVAKKLTHHFKVEADFETPYNVGLIVGSSGSGKTTLAKHIWGEGALERVLKSDEPVIDQFPKDMKYEDCVRLLTGVGLTHVPCWIRPVYTLSNGQRERAEIALQMATDRDLAVIDEWTSVVDRTVAKVMSHTVQKWARKTDRKVVLASCHYDVIEWLAPDWVIDCNKQVYEDRRRLRCNRPPMRFDIRECDRRSWKNFAKYHYLSDQLPGGLIETFGLYLDGEQIGFQCFANYVPKQAGRQIIMHSNRTVIHPDYVGLGLGMLLINETSEIMADRGFDVQAKFSSLPVYKAMKRDERWVFCGKERKHKYLVGGNMARDAGFRQDVTTYKFKFRPEHARTQTDTTQSARH